MPVVSPFTCLWETLQCNLQAAGAQCAQEAAALLQEEGYGLQSQPASTAKQPLFELSERLPWQIMLKTLSIPMGIQ